MESSVSCAPVTAATTSVTVSRAASHRWHPGFVSSVTDAGVGTPPAYAAGRRRVLSRLPKLIGMSDAALEAPSDSPIVAFFDVDNTLLRGASIFHIAKAARRMGLISIVEILRFCWHQAVFLFVGENLRHLGTIRDRALQLIGGRTEAELERLANEVFERDIQARLWPETVGLAREHMRKGHQVWLISATPQIVGNVIAQRLNLTGALGTRFVAENGTFTGEFDGPVLHGEEKAVAARKLTTQLGANLADCWAYSDSRNDIPLLTLVGNRVVVNPDARLAKHARSLGWPILQLKRASIREAQRRVRREAKATKKR
jgi:HAD superfamily hydrolase (TIGR01490 family)